MRFELDAKSMIVGAVLLSLLGMQSVSGVAPTTRVAGPPVRVVGVPDPRSVFEILEADGPYTVPPGKALVVEALGVTLQSGPSANVNLRVDSAHVTLVPVARGGMSSIPQPPVIPSGALVTTADGTGSSRAWGYLIDE